MTNTYRSTPFILIAILAVIQLFSMCFIGNQALSAYLLPAVMWLLVLWSFFSKTEHTITITAFGILLTLFFIWLSFVGLWSQMAQDHYYTLGYMLFWPLAYWLFMLRPELNRVWHILFFVMSVVILISTVVAIYQYLVLHTVPFGFFRDKNTQSTIANLFAFPMLAYLWISLANKQVRVISKVLLAAVILLLFLSVTITGSRGATLAAIFGLIIFIFMVRKQITLKLWFGLAALVLLPIIYGICFGLYAHTNASFASLLHPVTAGANRFVLWQPAWILIKEHGWFGIGLGNFAWYLPALRSVLDTSKGIYVHNDYLQIWLESGIIGIILLLAALASLGWLVIKFMRTHKIVDAKKIEVLGLALGIATVLFYSLFTFTLYLAPIVLPLGLYCGRLHYLIKDDLPLKEWVFNAVNYSRKSMFYLLGFIMALVLSIYYCSTAATLWLDNTGDEYLAAKNFNQAARYYRYASLLQPTRLELLISEQQLYNQQDQMLQPNQQMEKFQLSMQLEPVFEMLAKKYPLYAYNYFTQAEYYVRNKNMADKSSYCMTKQLYQKTLQLWPQFPPAQQGYAGFIKKFGDKPC